MACYHTLKAYKSLGKKTKSGKSVIWFNANAASGPYEEVELPCGRCIGCRIERSRSWALRCVHEASLYDKNCFITLTYDDEHIDPDGSLKKRDFQLFMKKLRKRHCGDKKVRMPDGELRRPIRFFQCGEYGDKLGRPHHHALLFNFDFQDRVLLYAKNGVMHYHSIELESIWENGLCEVGDLTFQSAAYVARYVMKKVNGDRAFEHYNEVDHETGEITRQVVPEYITMSRRPGIGAAWFDRFKSDVYPKDFVTEDGKVFKTPSYYDKLLERIDADELDNIRQDRRRKAESRREDHTLSRLRVQEAIKKRKVKKLVRSYEDGA